MAVAQRRTSEWLERGAVVTNVVAKAGRAGARWGEGSLIFQWVIHKLLNSLAELTFESRPLRQSFVSNISALPALSHSPMANPVPNSTSCRMQPRHPIGCCENNIN